MNQPQDIGTQIQNTMNSVVIPYHTHGGTDGPTIPIQNISGNYPQFTSVVSSATPAVNVNVTRFVSITALATAVSTFSTSLTGQPRNFDTLVYRIKDNGTSQTLAWGSSFAEYGVPLPTATTAGKVLTVGFIYDAVAAVWGCVAASLQT